MFVLFVILLTFMLPVSGVDELDNAEEQQNTVFWVQTIGGIVIAATIIIVLIKNRNAISGKSRKSISDINIDEDKVVDKIRLSDPDFNREQFRDYAKKSLYTVLDAISKRDSLSARQYVSDNLFFSHEKQIREDIEGQRINHMEDISISAMLIADYIENNDMNGMDTDTVTVLARVSMLDYTTDNSTGDVLDGSRLAHRNRSFKLEFLRFHGLKSSADIGQEKKCPACDKPFNITVTGKCDECKTSLCDGSIRWVLNSLSIWGREL